MAVDPAKLKAKARRLAVIEEDLCSGCEVCVYFCPVPGCILPVALAEAAPASVCRIVPERCIGCTLCAQYCPWECIVMLDPAARERWKAKEPYALA